MKPLPLPVRIAAGLAVTAAERARKLPQQLASLPVTVASQALQCSMRVQQHVTELAIKGDEVLSLLRPTEDHPDWATFDENDFDAREHDPDDATPTNTPSAPAQATSQAPLDTPAEHLEAPDETGYRPAADRNGASAHSAKPKPAPAALPGYDELSLPQLRARLRRLSLAQLEELLSYERSHAGRPPFVGMLSRRIETVRSQG
jgi:hypothetical protein